MPPTRIHHLKVVLLYVEPSVWRRLHVPSTIALTSLHRVLQVALDWQNQHLYEFQLGTLQIDAAEGPDVGITLADVADEQGARLLYRYDFGDGWEHDILVEAITSAEPDIRYPTCVGGGEAARARRSAGQ